MVSVRVSQSHRLCSSNFFLLRLETGLQLRVRVRISVRVRVVARVVARVRARVRVDSCLFKS